MLLSPRALTSIEDSDVYRMLQKDQEEPQEPRQSGSFKALQDFIDSDGELLLFLFLPDNMFPLCVPFIIQSNEIDLEEDKKTCISTGSVG